MKDIGDKGRRDRYVVGDVLYIVPGIACGYDRHGVSIFPLI